MRTIEFGNLVKHRAREHVISIFVGPPQFKGIATTEHTDDGAENQAKINPGATLAALRKRKIIVHVQLRAVPIGFLAQNAPWTLVLDGTRVTPL